MNTSKFLIAGLTVATLSIAPKLLARDTEEQIKAREALQQKMNELNAQSAPAPKPAAAPEKPAPTPAKAAPVQPAPVKPVAQPAPAPKPAPVAAAVAAPAPVAVPAPAPAPAPTKPVVQAEAVAVPAPTAKGDPAAANAREAALASAIGKSTGFGEVPPASNVGNVTASHLQASPAPKSSAATSTGASSPRPGQYQPLQAPASPLDAARQSQLAELLRRYRAEEITPEQYHTERAKIIGAK